MLVASHSTHPTTNDLHSYQPVQPIAPTSIPLVDTSLPLLQNQTVVQHPFQAGPSTQCPQVLGPQTPTPSAGLQQPHVPRIIYSQVGLPYYGMSQPQPIYTYPQSNPIYPNLGYKIGGQIPW